MKTIYRHVIVKMLFLTFSLVAIVRANAHATTKSNVKTIALSHAVASGVNEIQQCVDTCMAPKTHACYEAGGSARDLSRCLLIEEIDCVLRCTADSDDDDIF